MKARLSPQPAARRPHLGSTRSWPTALLAGMGLCALALASAQPHRVRLIYNASNSVPVGWYRIATLPPEPHALQVGELVLASLPPAAQLLAAQRHYLPFGIAVLKPVAALAPHKVCVLHGLVQINGVAMARVLTADRLGRRLSAWPGCRSLKTQEVFLLSTSNVASFDSRYFGPIPVDQVLGIAHPLWVKEQS